MSFISDDVIDPELLRQSQAGTAVPGDPAMRFLLQARSGAHVPSIGNSSGTFNPANEDEDEDLEDIPDRISAPLATTHRNLAAATNTSVVSNLITFGNTIKRAKKFESRTEGEFDKYCSTADPEERMLLDFALSLEIRDLLQQLVKPQNWTISDSLEKSVTLYTKAFLLSPTVKSYKGNGPEHVLKAMRELNVTDLPAEKDVIQVSGLVSVIGKKLTDHRNAIKSKLKRSIEVDSDLRNIADLTSALIDKSRIQPTLRLYMRVAFLRWHLVTYGDTTEFWDRVDETLKKFVNEAQSSVELTSAFNGIYEEDKTQFGDPVDAMSKLNVVDPTNVDDWFKTIEKHSTAAQGGAPSQRKRRRTKQ